MTYRYSKLFKASNSVGIVPLSWLFERDLFRNILFDLENFWNKKKNNNFGILQLL